MNDETTTGSTLRAVEQNLASMTEARSRNSGREAAPVPTRRSTATSAHPPARSWDDFAGDPDDAPRSTAKARKRTAPAAVSTVARPIKISESMALFNIAYEVLRNARDCRDPNTPEMARTLYAIDIANDRDSWPETQKALMAFVKANEQYVMSIDSKARWGQFTILGL